MEQRANSKNLIVAISLSMIVMLAWQFFYEKPRLEAVRQEKARMASMQEEQNLSVQSSDSQNQLAVDKIISRKEAVTAVERVIINNGKLHGSLSLKGARFDDLTLANYRQSLDKSSPEVVLLSPALTNTTYFAEFGWLGNNIKLPDSNTIWKSDKRQLGKGEKINLTWDNGEGLFFGIEIALDKNYMFDIKQSIRNETGKKVSLAPYGRLNRAYQVSEVVDGVREFNKQGFYILHEGGVGVFDQVLQEQTYESLFEDKKFSLKDKEGWLGITDKYWLTAIIPNLNEKFDVNFSYFNKKGRDKFQSDYVANTLSVDPGQTIETGVKFFAGAKELNLLDSYKEQFGIPLFDKAVDLGWLYFITKPFFKLLSYIYELIGNFGVSILIVTVIIKIFLFPLANKSFVSMGKLKQLQPEINALRERYGKDKSQMHKEMMALYQREKVNPMAGCLPILIQIPIFFALYKVLFVTIEMRHQPFFGWIDDLSAYDPTSIFNLFGLIPWQPPEMFIIGAWPLIMGVTLLIQQSLQPKPADPTQAKVMKMLPFIFIFIFAKFPAGLVIYWSWSNILSILQQWLITKKINKPSAAVS